MAHRTSFAAIVLTALLVLFSSLNVLANDPGNKERKSFSKNALQNLVTGIQSENTGLKKSSIYFSGLYEVEETVDALVDQLNKEEDPSVRVLIALALYKIGTEKSITAIQDLAVEDQSLKVRRMSKAILDEAQLNPDYAVIIE